MNVSSSMSRHRKAVLIFGFVGPLVIAMLVSALLLGVRSKVFAKYELRSKAKEGLRVATVEVETVRKFMESDGRLDNLRNWEEDSGKDFFQLFSQSLDESMSQLPEGSLRRTAMGQADGASSIGSASGLSHSRITLSFEGNYQAMQSVMARLEAKIPTLILEDLEIVRNPSNNRTERNILLFRVTYINWEMAESGR